MNDSIKVRTLTQKAVMMAVKQGKGYSSLCAEYDCTREELLKHVEDIFRYPHKVQTVVGSLRKNEKRSNKQRAKATKATTEAVLSRAATVEVGARPTSVDLVADTTTATEPADPTSATTSDISPTRETLLRSLEAEEDALSRAAIRLESERKTAMSEHRRGIERLLSIRAQVEQLKNRLRDICSIYEQTVEENDALARKISELTGEHRDYIERLGATRTKIEALRAIELLVYADGTIEADDGLMQLDDSGAEAKYIELVSLDELSDLRARDIRTLARVLSIEEHISVATVAFDLAEMQSAYEALHERGKA